MIFCKKRYPIMANLWNANTTDCFTFIFPRYMHTRAQKRDRGMPPREVCLKVKHIEPRPVRRTSYVQMWSDLTWSMYGSEAAESFLFRPPSSEIQDLPVVGFSFVMCVRILQVNITSTRLITTFSRRTRAQLLVHQYVVDRETIAISVRSREQRGIIVNK